jgi:acyl-CoA synthetase (AMP-forming)/AMP-acid ligase II
LNTTPETIIELLATGADDEPAILAPGRPLLTYSGLRRQVEETVLQLQQFGIRGDDVVAIVLPNGPEMATAFVSIAVTATTAPLNPAYTQTEMELYLEDLGARLLVVQEGVDTPARAAANKLGIPISQV